MLADLAEVVLGVLHGLLAAVDARHREVGILLFVVPLLVAPLAELVLRNALPGALATEDSLAALECTLLVVGRLDLACTVHAVLLTKTHPPPFLLPTLYSPAAYHCFSGSSLEFGSSWESWDVDTSLAYAVVAVEPAQSAPGVKALLALGSILSALDREVAAVDTWCNGPIFIVDVFRLAPVLPLLEAVAADLMLGLALGSALVAPHGLARLLTLSKLHRALILEVAAEELHHADALATQPCFFLHTSIALQKTGAKSPKRTFGFARIARSLVRNSSRGMSSQTAQTLTASPLK
jgi:hypothetical protein